MSKTLEESQVVFAPTLVKLLKYNGTSLFVAISYKEEETFADYYNAFSGIEVPAGRHTIPTHLQHTSNIIELLGGGQLAADARAHPLSSVNPAWRTMIVHHILGRTWTRDTPQAVVGEIHADITNVKVRAMKELAPNTGCYMNEADRLDPEWQRDFYRGHYAVLESIKRRYDPDDVFYCPTCVGSEDWVELESGRLCRRNKGAEYVRG
ncbi:hypothetical protein LTR66_006116 [Elasticomyces elasticus]|nr:hypothetical protein LTR66_006116 [Elasticomyces elasticus]KAK5008030.1 hypothetical protein LTR28_004520 [Elasticomyces elasticus]